MKKHTSWLLAAIAIGLPLAAASEANPAENTSAVSALRYSSAFADYKPWQELEPGDWRAMNEALRGPGGGHAGDPSEPPAAAARPANTDAAARQPAPAAAGHGAHQMQGGPK